jgi:hypothetical protein
MATKSDFNHEFKHDITLCNIRKPTDRLEGPKRMDHEQDLRQAGQDARRLLFRAD